MWKNKNVKKLEKNRKKKIKIEKKRLVYKNATVKNMLISKNIR